MVNLSRRRALKTSRTTPGGRRIKVYKRAKHTDNEMAKLAKTEKRPERLFGGVLCSNCVKQLLKEKTRLQGGVLREEDVDLLHLKYIKMLK